MNPSRPQRNSREAFAGLVAVAALLTGCATTDHESGSARDAKGVPVQMGSPRAVDVTPAEAWRRAEALAAGRPDREVLIGRGDSMEPMYPDRTVLVVERMRMSVLQPGMTVVFWGDSGRPVAHVLSHRTSTGWVAQGLANARADRMRVRPENYLGAVVAAFTTSSSPGNGLGIPRLAPLGRVATAEGASGRGRPNTAYFSGRRAAGQ